MKTFKKAGPGLFCILFMMSGGAWAKGQSTELLSSSKLSMHPRTLISDLKNAFEHPGSSPSKLSVAFEARSRKLTEIYNWGKVENVMVKDEGQDENLSANASRCLKLQAENLSKALKNRPDIAAFLKSVPIDQVKLTVYSDADAVGHTIGYFSGSAARLYRKIKTSDALPSIEISSDPILFVNVISLKEAYYNPEYRYDVDNCYGATETDITAYLNELKASVESLTSIKRSLGQGFGPANMAAPR